MTLSGEQLYQEWQAGRSAGLTKAQVGAAHGLTYGQAAGRIWRYQQHQNGGQPDRSDLFVVSLGEPLILEGDAVIVGDIHVPCTDYDWAQRAAMVGLYHLAAPRTLVIAGDLVNADFASRYDLIHELPRWDQEVQAARHLFRVWLEVFDRVIFLAGNHERRLSKFTRGELGMQHLADLLLQDERVIVSHWGHCLLISGGIPYRVTHARNYSLNSLTVGHELANKYQQHIINHHQHHLSKGMDRFKRFIVIDNGALVDQDKLAYVVLDDSRSPAMAKGFTLVRGGVAHVLGEAPYTSWEEWLAPAEGVGSRRRRKTVKVTA